MCPESGALDAWRSPLILLGDYLLAGLSHGVFAGLCAFLGICSVGWGGTGWGLMLFTKHSVESSCVVFGVLLQVLLNFSGPGWCWLSV